MTNYSRQKIIPEELSGLRLDLALAKTFSEFSRSRIKSWILDGSILIEGEKLRPRDIVNGGENVSIQVIYSENIKNEPEPMVLDIEYEDEEIAVINKPVGLVVHPGAGNFTGTLMNSNAPAVGQY